MTPRGDTERKNRKPRKRRPDAKDINGASELFVRGVGPEYEELVMREIQKMGGRNHGLRFDPPSRGRGEIVCKVVVGNPPHAEFNLHFLFA